MKTFYVETPGDCAQYRLIKEYTSDHNIEAPIWRYPETPLSLIIKEYRP